MVVNTEFKIGEIVVCINARRRWYRLGGLKKNEMYTIEGFNPHDGGLILKETKSPTSGYNAYRASRFRKVDYEFAQRVIDKIRPQETKKRELSRVIRQLLSKRFDRPLID